jgi:hypothetical protein
MTLVYWKGSTGDWKKYVEGKTKIQDCIAIIIKEKITLNQAIKFFNYDRRKKTRGRSDGASRS